MYGVCYPMHCFCLDLVIEGPRVQMNHAVLHVFGYNPSIQVIVDGDDKVQSNLLERKCACVCVCVRVCVCVIG